MSADTALTVHLSILAGGVVIWFAAIWFHRRCFAPADPRDPELVARGEVDVAVVPGVVREKLVAALGGTGGVWNVLLSEATDERVAGTIAPLGTKKGFRPRSFSIRLRSWGSGTRAEWEIRSAGVGGFLVAARIFTYVLPPLAMGTMAFLTQFVFLPSDDPAVRGQAIQTAQIVHFLWPPFLFGGLHRRIVRVAGTALTTAIRNTAF